MKRHQMPQIKEGGVNVTPLIDVVMCLIIFFMLVARIGVNDGSDEKVDLPKTYLGKKIDDMGNTLVLNVKLAVGEERLAKIRDNRDIPEELQVLAVVPDERTGGSEKREIPIQDKNTKEFVLRKILVMFRDKFKGNFKLILRCDKDTPFFLLQNVLAESANAGVTNLAFSTTEGSVNDVQGAGTVAAPAAAP